MVVSLRRMRDGEKQTLGRDIDSEAGSGEGAGW